MSLEIKSTGEILNNGVNIQDTIEDNVESTVTSAVTTNLSAIDKGFKNHIINGAFDIWQRGTSGFGHNVYFADRWRDDYNTGNGVTISKYEIPSGGEAGLPNTFTSAMKYSLTVGSGAGAGLNDVRQRIENPKMFDGQTVTLSYYVKASSNCTVNNRRVYPESVTNRYDGVGLPSVNVTTEWQKVTDTVTFGTSSTAVYSDSSFLDVVISAPVATTVDIDYYVTGVQLELGSVATPFEHRPYGLELSLCQRYWFKETCRRIMGYKRHDQMSNFDFDSPVPLRRAPTVILASGGIFTNFQSGFGTTQSSASIYEWAPNSTRFIVQLATDWGSTHTYVPSWEGYEIQFDAEL